ncbi:MAG: hypothetical protein A4E19_13840 [Nitrospira sp. SG-bin1]|nr:MAG: hypothetical protein A4E19_13840 [Nitrospira sp. SG-bin1]
MSDATETIRHRFGVRDDGDMMPRWLKWMAVGMVALVALVLAAAYFADEPLRRYVEQSANRSMDGYSLHIGTLDLHPLTLSVDLHDVVVRQKAHPDPQLLDIPKLVIDARIAPLLTGKVAADIHLRDPVVSVTRLQMDTAIAQGREKSPEADQAVWQDQVRDMVPFESAFFIKNGAVSYAGHPAAEPIHVTALDVVVRHVTNRPEQSLVYPAEMHVTANLLDHAEVEITGRADPFAKPLPAVQVGIRADQLEIDKALTAAGRTDLPIKSGSVSLAGHIEYGPSERAVTIDSVRLMRPAIEYVNQPAAAGTAAAGGDAAAEVPTWQKQMLALVPLSIREAVIDDGTVTYRHASQADPIHLRGLTASVHDVRNVASKKGEYPSRVQGRVRLGEQGLVEIDGRGDLFAQPTPAIDARVRLDRLRLRDVAPIAKAYNVHIHDGLFRMEGQVKHDRGTMIALESFLLEKGKVDYVYKPETQEKQRRQVRRGVTKAAKAHRDASFVFRMGHGKILSSEVGFINRTTEPDYRMFLADLNADMDNFSNRLEEGTGVVKVTGKFMGSGPTVMTGTFRPEKPRPDFDLAVTIIRTDVTALNEVLRAYGNVDTHHGKFALFSELTVHNNRIDGYVKPLFRDVDVYDPDKDQDKALSRQIYKAVVGGVMSLLENQPRDEVATKADMSGALDNPEVSTWQIIATLVQNAFFNAILPGFAGNT